MQANLRYLAYVLRHHLSSQIDPSLETFLDKARKFKAVTAEDWLWTGLADLLILAQKLLAERFHDLQWAHGELKKNSDRINAKDTKIEKLKAKIENLKARLKTRSDAPKPSLWRRILFRINRKAHESDPQE